VDVVEQIPTNVIGIVVNDEVIAAIPAPVLANKPVPWSNFKVEAGREPETMVVAVDADEGIPVVRTKMFEVSVFEGMIEAIAFVVRCIVTIPVIVVNTGIILPL